ncbi:MAG: M36 family metallopeptidase [Actinobacteria bacterium]|nr:M36 family metallopeptidase [Actinomycetota bacterium]
MGLLPISAASSAVDAAPGDPITTTGAAVGGISSAEAGSRALAHLAERRAALGLEGADIASAVVTDIVPVGDTGAWVVHLQQRFDGLDVSGGVMSVVVDGTGAVRSLGDRFERRLTTTADGPPPEIDSLDAVRSAVDALGLVASRPFRQVATEPGAESATTVTTGGVSADPIPVRLVLQPDETADVVHLAWEVTIREPDGENWWVVSVDADTGDELDRINYTSGATYEGFDAPVESPSFGTRSTIVDPADPVASPFGWHDTNGVPGAEFTVTRGNNVSAYTDVDANNVADPSSQPDGGAGLVFTAPLDLGQPPSTATAAAVINAFQFVNRLHDIAYAFGFDEASGNFQANNYGRGGAAALGGDPVLVEVLDGSGVDNANFTTAPDGFAGRMQLMPFTTANPDRDSAFDNGIVAHEYAHGISNRLTGGPSNVTCLQNTEQPGEGWSDWFALMMTLEPGDLGTDPRPIGTWALGQAATGPGLRSSPYSTDLGVDPSTYADVAAAGSPHAVGEVFAAMLWDLSWALVERDGFDPDWIGGTGGNITAMQLVLDGMKLQPCSPGFVDARDAILLADQLHTGGANQCVIWEAFAARGLGESASQGSPASRTDGAAAFDVPDQCLSLVLTTTASTSVAAPGSTVTYSSTVTNTATVPATGVVVGSTVPAGSTYVVGSATCGGTHAAGVVTVTIPTVAAGAAVTCTYAVTAGTSATDVWLHEDFEHGTDRWLRTHTAGTIDWTASGVAAHTGVLGARVDGTTSASAVVLGLAEPVTVTGAHPTLRFLHQFDTERQSDGGIVELSTNGVTWADLGPAFVRNGYTHQLASGPNPIAPRPAFTGSSGGVVESVADLTPWIGQQVRIRFRFGSDNGVASTGWRVDDVRLGDEVVLSQTATLSSASGAADATATDTLVRGDLPATTGLLRVTTDPPVPSRISVDGIVRNDWGLDWVSVLAGSHEVCWSDVVGFGTPACQTVVVTPGQTTSVVGSFARLGLLQVGVQPVGLPTTIFVDGHVAEEYGLFSFVEPGQHEICWGDVSGPWQAPACQSVTVIAGATTQVTGTFVSTPTPAPGPAPQLGPTGFLRVSTSPAVASRVVVDGIPRADWALTWVKMPVGVHEVCFTDVVGFVTPPCQQVLVEQGATTTVAGAFSPLGLLQVAVAPAGLPVDVLVDGEPHNQFGSFAFVEPGTHEVCGTARPGWATPACTTVVVGSGSLAQVTLTYQPIP